MFSEILKKIDEAQITLDPFLHIEINDLFHEDTFRSIVSAPEIALRPMRDDRELVDSLSQSGWKPIPFPGTTENVETYVKWHQSGGKVLNNNTCEGFGITYRLFEPKSDIVRQLNEFLASEPFRRVLMGKFGISEESIEYDAGIQKYLDGYEISPHPDIRRKALTYMVNINPAPDSESLNYHTHYMTFEPARQYVGSYWQHNPSSERCWVPWDWCRTVKQQTRNNSMVIFAPNFDTLHAVRAKYDHLRTQRTQLYGNFWFKNPDPITLMPDWEHYVIGESASAGLKRHVPDVVKKYAKAVMGRGSLKAGKRSVKA